MPAAFGLVIGTLSTILSAVWISKALGLSDTIQATSAVKAVTTQVAIEAVVLIGGDPALAAAFVISSCIFGAVFGPPLLSFMKINDPFSRGLGIGTVSHGIGTSQAVVEGRLQVPFQALRWGLRRHYYLYHTSLDLSAYTIIKKRNPLSGFAFFLEGSISTMYLYLKKQFL
jgi:putative effector of murein hydrolase